MYVHDGLHGAFHQHPKNNRAPNRARDHHFFEHVFEQPREGRLILRAVFIFDHKAGGCGLAWVTHPDDAVRM